MANLQTNLQRLETNSDEISSLVADISDAIIAKGGTVPSNAGLRSFPSAIATIPSGGNYSITVLWDYTTDNNGTIPYDPFTGTLQDDINNYDAIQLEMVSYEDDLDTSDWNATMFTPIIPVYVLNNSLKNNYFNHTSFETRSTNWYIKDTTVQKIATNVSRSNGLVRVYGIKF